MFDQSENRSRKWGARASYERAVPGFEALVATIGFDALWDKSEQRLIATNRVWVPPADFQSTAPFAQANLKLFDGGLRTAGGVRWENVKVRINDYHTLASTTYDGRNPATYGGISVKGGEPGFNRALLNGGVIVEPVAGIRAYASYAEGSPWPISAASPARSARPAPTSAISARSTRSSPTIARSAWR